MDTRRVEVFISMLLLVCVAAMPSDTQPITQPEDVATLQKENRELREEIADLRAEIAVLRAKMNTTSTVPPLSTTTKPSAVKLGVPAKPFQSYEEVISELPADDKPPQGRSWDTHFLTKANDWIRDNIVGRQMILTTNFLQIEKENSEETTADFIDRRNRGGHQQQTLDGEWLTGIFAAANSDELSKLRDNEAVRLTGTIHEFRLDSGNGGKSLQVWATLSTCHVSTEDN
jgi:hypothetical protein